MRNEYYGDKRDAVKWTSVLHIAQREGICRIVQVAMCTDTVRAALPVIGNLDGEIVQCQAVAEQVADHFHRHNDLNGIRSLGEHLNVNIETWLMPFAHAGRAGYFANVLNEIRRSATRTIWFLDPDTGIEPQRPSEKHIRLQELSDVFGAMPLGDWLTCYQHAWREDNWQTLARARLAAQLGVVENRVEVFTSDYASDVIILAVEKL